MPTRVASGRKTTGTDIKRVNGGILVQDRDQGMVGLDDLKVAERQPTEQELKICCSLESR